MTAYGSGISSGWWHQFLRLHTMDHVVILVYVLTTVYIRGL